jgi:ribulose-5-phosphate 4-epimerase/fuculose-1-phosphate aldolase
MTVPIFETPEAMVKKLDRRVAMMIQGHGATTVGKSAKDAAVNSIYLERDAYMQLMAYAAGDPKPLLERDYAKGYGKNVHEPLFQYIWGYYEERLERGSS